MPVKVPQDAIMENLWSCSIIFFFLTVRREPNSITFDAKFCFERDNEVLSMNTKSGYCSVYRQIMRLSTTVYSNTNVEKKNPLRPVQPKIFDVPGENL